MTVLPRSIATKAAFENAMSLDIAMGGSTNTILHLLAAAFEAKVDFKMADIDRLSRRVPCLSKVAPATQKYHMEDVHRAGGVMAILAELNRAGLLTTDVPTVHSDSLEDALQKWDITNIDNPHNETARQWYLAPWWRANHTSVLSRQLMVKFGCQSRIGLHSLHRPRLFAGRGFGGIVWQYC